MALLLKSITLSVSITCPPSTVYGFIANPAHLPQWRKVEKSKVFQRC